METIRLYVDDAYRVHFTARIVEARVVNQKPQVALDATAFYPEGGGQPADTGTLNGINVLDVQSESGVIWHTLAAPLDEPHVTGTIDWTRRFDHMQQHNGQHLLSAVFVQLYGMNTTAFHLGTEVVTIDLDTPTLDAAQVAAVEDSVNELISRDLPVVARFVTNEELATLPLRKPPKVTGTIRVVSIEGIDYSACGGTHPRSTGGVGVVHIRHWERRGNETRVEFLCGSRAVRDYRQRDLILKQLAAEASVAITELPASIARLRASEQQSRKELQQAQHQLLTHEAAALLQQTTGVTSPPVIARTFTNRDVKEVRLLARLLVEQGAVALLGVQNERGQLVFAAADTQVHCGNLLRDVLAAHGGRGGGQATAAEGGLPDPSRIPQIIAEAAGRLESPPV